MNTRLQTLVSLHNEQQELVINREAGIRVLQRMAEEDPDRVLTTAPDLDTLTPKAITVRSRLKEMEETYQIDLARLEVYQDMITEERTKEESQRRSDSQQTGSNTAVEKE